jgi:hypothetical protein
MPRLHLTQEAIRHALHKAQEWKEGERRLLDEVWVEAFIAHYGSSRRRPQA